MNKIASIFFVCLIVSFTYSDEITLLNNDFYLKCSCDSTNKVIEWQHFDTSIIIYNKKYSILKVTMGINKETFYVRFDSTKIYIISDYNLRDSIYEKEYDDEKVFLDFNKANKKSWKLYSTYFFDAAEFKLDSVYYDKNNQDELYLFKNISLARLSHSTFIKELIVSPNKGFRNIVITGQYNRPIYTLKCI